MKDSTTTTSAHAVPAEHVPVISRHKAKRLYIIIAATIAAIIVLSGIWALVSSGKESTDDAQVAADVVPVASRVAGQVVRLAVHENQPVHSGDLIAEIDPRDAQVRLSQAESELETARAQATEADAKVQVARASAHGGLEAAQAGVQSSREGIAASSSSVNEARAAVDRAEANAEKARLDLQRAMQLGEKGDISRAQVDAARAAAKTAQADLDLARARLNTAETSRQLAQANLQQAQGRLVQSSPIQAQIDAAAAAAAVAHARVKGAQAAVDAARLALSYTRITAPADGIASKLGVHNGSLVAPGQAIVQLVPRTTYVVANFKETQLKGMKAGQHATIEVDALNGKEFEGTVESLSGGTGATFSLLPPDNASGNFVKVVQRVPVRVRWNGPSSDLLPVGTSAVVTVRKK